MSEAGQPEYCNVCENFPCLGNHPPGEIEQALERYGQAAECIRRGVMSRAELESEILGGDDFRQIYFSPLRNSLVTREGFELEKRAAEERNRREWAEGIRRRLGLVAEVHRCGVERPDCGEFRVYRPTQAAAFAEALAHARSFVPEPPEEEPVTGLDLYEKQAAREFDNAMEEDRTWVLAPVVRLIGYGYRYRSGYREADWKP